MGRRGGRARRLRGSQQLHHGHWERLRTPRRAGAADRASACRPCQQKLEGTLIVVSARLQTQLPAWRRVKLAATCAETAARAGEHEG